MAILLLKGFKRISRAKPTLQDGSASVGWGETQQKLLHLLRCWVSNPIYLTGRLKTFSANVGWVYTQQKLFNLLQCWVFTPTYPKGRLKTFSDDLSDVSLF